MAAIPRSVKLAGGAAAYVFGVGVAYEISRPIPPLPSAKQRCCTFDSLAPGYDKDIEKDEQTSGILDLRKEMAKLARGKVLEIAGGTGRNLGFYDGDAVTDLLIGDYSEKMLHVAAHKVAHMRQPAPGGSSEHQSAESLAPQQRLASRVTLAVLDACALTLPSATFDTVVDTFGICSFEKPEVALQELARCCKPGGTVLLLEHGVSDWAVLAWWQQHRLNRHVVKWGCYWNRDILKLVRDSGLRIEEVKRKHFGTTVMLVCRKD